MTDSKKWDLSHFPVTEIKMAKENDNIYDRFSSINFDDNELIESIRDKGILEPLVISTDQMISRPSRNKFSRCKRSLIRWAAIKGLQLACLRVNH